MEKLTINTFRNLLGKRIKQLRLESKLTQAALAIKIGFKDKQVVNLYELKGANPTAFNLALIAKALNVTVDELLDFEKLKNGKSN